MWKVSIINVPYGAEADRVVPGKEVNTVPMGWLDSGKDKDITFEIRTLVLSILLFFSWRICSGGEFALENKRVDSCSQESSHAWKSVKSERIYVHTKVCHGGKTKQKINSRSGTSGLEISTRDRVGISRFPTGLS